MRIVEDKKEIIIPKEIDNKIGDTFWEESWGDIAQGTEVKNIDKFGIERLIEVVPNLGGEYKIRYRVVKDEGRFITFCGMMVNTESGYIALGYNNDNKFYIPVARITDVFNSAVFGGSGGSGGELGLEDVLYIIEEFKINFREFKVVEYIKKLVGEGGVRFSSVSIEFLRGEMGKSGENNLNVMEDSDFYLYMVMVFQELMEWVDKLGRKFFWRFILGEGPTVDVGDPKKMDVMYVKWINAGVDRDFLLELSSCGVARNRRCIGASSEVIGVVKSFRKDGCKGAAYLSSWTFYDQFDLKSIEYVKEEKIRSYNINDLVRAVDRDVDLFFSVGIYGDSKKPFEVLMGKLGVLVEIDKIGRRDFIENTYEFSKMLATREMGGSYSRKVKREQASILPAGERSIIGAGRVLEKITKRIEKVMKGSHKEGEGEKN